MLLFGAETWVLEETMLQKLEGLNVVLLRKVVDILTRNLEVNTWKKEGEERLLQATGEKTLRD